jgi:hypothetical protein
LGACLLLGAASPSPAPSPAAPHGPAAPQILSIWATPKVVHSGDLVQWTVRTSDDVTRVTAGIPNYEFALERRSAGRFWTAFRLPPNVPQMFKHEYKINVTAFGPGGHTTSSMSLRFE